MNILKKHESLTNDTEKPIKKRYKNTVTPIERICENMEGNTKKLIDRREIHVKENTARNF